MRFHAFSPGGPSALTRAWILAALLLQPALPAWAEASPPSPSSQTAEASQELDAAALGNLIWAHNPDVDQARLALAQNRTDVLRASLWQNPTIQAGVGNMPLSRMMLSSPNYSNPPLDPLVGPNLNVSISQPVEFGKREVRIQRYRQSLSVAQKALELLYYQRVTDLAEVLVLMAVSRLRQELLSAQLASLRSLYENVSLSVEKGFSPPLDAERLSLEIGRLQVNSDAEQLSLQGLKNQWSRLTLTVAPALTQAQAQAIIARWCQPPTRWPTRFALPQQAVIEAQQAETRLDLELAKRMAWPDPAFQMGYTYDSLPTGNVMHTLNTSVSLPMPVWQYGQADAQAALGHLEELKHLQRALEANLTFQEPSQRQQILTLQKNIQDLETQRLVLARATLQRYEQALNAHGMTLGDVIQTRRTVLDLESERLDLLQQLGLALVDYRRLTNWNLPEPQGATP